MQVSIIFAFAMLISGFLNYIGFGLRAFQIRFFWPIYLSLFFGLGIYMLLKFVIKKWNIIYSIVIAAIFIVLFLGIIEIPGIPNYENINSQGGIMDIYHWSALQWLSKNTEADSNIYFFYGDTYSQDALLRNSKRLHYQVDPQDFVNAIKERKIKRNYLSELPGDTGGSISVRTGIFSFKDVTEGVAAEYFYGNQDICKFDYFVLDIIYLL